MRTTFERLLHLGVAAVTLAAAFGLDPAIAAVFMAAINVGLALSVGKTR